MMGRPLQAIPITAAALLVVILARPNLFSLVLGGILVMVGEAVRIWACGHLVRNKEVTTSGPYAYVRDPLYLGRFFLLVGFCVMAWGYNWILLAIGLGVFFMKYMPRKHRKEMARLRDLFGEEYTRYAAGVRSLIPRLSPYDQARQRAWSFKLFWDENREQYLLSGVILLFLLIIGRYLYQY